jgi:hypothetical protein
VPEPEATAAPWGEVLGVAAAHDALDLDGGHVRFIAGDAGLAEIAVAVPDDVRNGRNAVEIAGVRFTLSPL